MNSARARWTCSAIAGEMIDLRIEYPVIHRRAVSKHDWHGATARSATRAATRARRAGNPVVHTATFRGEDVLRQAGSIPCTAATASSNTCVWVPPSAICHLRRSQVSPPISSPA